MSIEYIIKLLALIIGYSIIILSSVEVVVAILWWGTDKIVHALGLYGKFIDAVYNRAKYKQKENE